MGFREQDFSSAPISIPTSEPLTAQISYTVQQSDLPTITPSISIGNVVGIYMTGANSKVAGSTLTYTVYKNGVSLITTTTTSIVNTQNCWGMVHWRWTNVQVGDLLEVKVWATTGTATGFTIDYSNMRTYANQPDIGLTSAKSKLLKDVKVTIGITQTPTISPATANGTTTSWNIANSGSPVFYPCSVNSATINVGATMTIPLLQPYINGSTNTGLYRNTNGDTSPNITTSYSHTSLRQYQVNYQVSAIEYRELR
jgi:hypothetical protein